MNTSIDTAPWALTNALLIDGTGAPAVVGATVVVAGNTITAVGDATVIPPGARVVDVQGRTVLPGLIDAHVHLGGGSFGEGARFNGRASSGDYAAPRADALRYGVTTQRTPGDYLHDSVAVRDEIDAGRLSGARIVTSGASFQVRGGHPSRVGQCWSRRSAGTRRRGCADPRRSGSVPDPSLVGITTLPWAAAWPPCRSALDLLWTTRWKIKQLVNHRARHPPHQRALPPARTGQGPAGPRRVLTAPGPNRRHRTGSPPHARRGWLPQPHGSACCRGGGGRAPPPPGTARLRCCSRRCRSRRRCRGSGRSSAVFPPTASRSRVCC